ncbi:MAG: SusD/RagB family nutrient-binding outer membrane lipoprotein [Weeksellaceae bacterium]
MKKNILIVLAIGFALFSTSCRQDFEEINTNPNKPTAVPTYGIFNSATKELADATRGAFSSGRFFLPWVQYSAQVNYTDEDRYKYRENVNQNLYRDYYYVAQDFKTIIDLNTDEATKELVAAYGDNDNQVAVARIMLSYIFANLVETYGDVPYYSYGNSDADFQALQPDLTSTPLFADQEKVYADILKELKEASEMLNTNEKVFTSEGDQLFYSDATKWKKFANSLRLRYANRVKGILPGAETHISEAIASGVMESNDDNASQKYDTSDALASPLYRAFVVDARYDIAVSDTFIDLLVDSEDPRVFEMAAPKGLGPADSYDVVKDFSLYQGMPYAVSNANTGDQFKAGVSTFSHNILKPDYSEMFMEYAEVAFLLSENNGWSQDQYIKGITASMERWGVDPADISTYVSKVDAANKENVLTQKYIALFMQPREAWSEYRRTGYPEIFLLPGQTNDYLVPTTKGETTYVFESSIDGLTDVPSRVLYPVNLATLNKDNYLSAQQAVGGDKMDTKLFWDVN